MTDTKTLFMFKNCDNHKGYESPSKGQNSIKKIRSMSKQLDMNLNMNHKTKSKEEYKIKNYEDDNVFLRSHKAVNLNQNTDKNNIFKSNSINRVVDPTYIKPKYHDTYTAERLVESKFTNNFNYDSISRPKITDSIRSKINMLSTEINSINR